MFSEVVKFLLKVFFDFVEKCWELFIIIIWEFMEKVEKLDESLFYVMFVLVLRLG